MKKLLIVPFILLATFSFGQSIDTLLSIKNGHSGKPLFDTAIAIASNYLLTPTTTSLSFDSSKVVTSVVINGTGDSIYVYKGGIKVGVIKLGTGGGSSPWTVSGSNIYYSSGNVGINTSTPQVPFHVNAIMSVGDSVTTANAYRQFNVTGSNAGVSIHRISANVNTASPTLQFLHSTPGAAGFDVFWDVYADSSGMSFRNRIVNNHDTVPLTISNNNNVIVGYDRTNIPSAIMSVNSTNKGFLLPRQTTTQMNAIIAPANGLLIYNTTANGIYMYSGGAWVPLSSPTLVTDSIQVRSVNITGKTKFGGNTVLSASVNGPLYHQINNTNSGAAAEAKISLLSNAGGVASFGYTGLSFTPYKTLTASAAYLYTTTGDLVVLNDNATGSLQWAAGGSGTNQMTLSPSGVLGIGSSLQFKVNNAGLISAEAGSGQVALVAGTKAITITGLTTSSLAFVQMVSPSGITTTAGYKAVCTANTLTITAYDNTGATATSDVSTVNYRVIAK